MAAKDGKGSYTSVNNAKVDGKNERYKIFKLRRCCLKL